MTLSIGPATDYLYGLAQQAVTGITVNGKPMVAVDGEPDELEFGMFVIGLRRPPPPPELDGDTPATRARVSPEIGLGFDEYTIPCYIDCRVSGGVQKTARDAAAAVFDAFWVLFTADLTLGGALRNGTADVTEILATPSNVGTAAEKGRRQLISFGVTCTGLS